MENNKNIFTQTNALLLAVCLMTLFLVIRSTGLLPAIFADEYTYSKLSRLLPLNESTIPSYLYLKLYGVTNFCGNGFRECAKILNAFLFSLSIPFIYWIARSISSRRVSILVTLLAVAGPINSYTAYFMPESFYFLSIWGLLWFLLKLDSESSSWQWLFAGLIYGMTSLIKIHSIFFLPALILYIGFIYYQSRQLVSARLLLAVFSFMIGAVTVKFMGGYLLAGTSGLFLFGPFYASHAPTEYHLLKLLAMALESARGHLLTLSLIYGLPAAIAIGTAFRILLRQQLPRPSADDVYLEKTIFLALMLILNLVAVAALFTASIANTDAGPYETPYRLHMRYYNFALPLFFIIAAGALSLGGTRQKQYVRYLLGGALALCAAWALHTSLAPYLPSIVDNPELRGLNFNSQAFQIAGAILLASLLLWIFSEEHGIKLYLFVAAPLFIALSSFYVSIEQRNRLVADEFDRAGEFARDNIPAEAASQIMFMGSNTAGLFRAAYYLDTPDIHLKPIPANGTIDASVLPLDKEWIMIIGDHRLDSSEHLQLHLNGFIVARKPRDDIDFKHPSWPDLVANVAGLSSAESWGTWSASDTVEFEFIEPLPEQFELRLTASAFGANAGAEIQAVVDDHISRFTLSERREQRALMIDNPGKSNKLKFLIPHAASPKELGMSNDDRKLGMAFYAISILSDKTMSNRVIKLR